MVAESIWACTEGVGSHDWPSTVTLDGAIGMTLSLAEGLVGSVRAGLDNWRLASGYVLCVGSGAGFEVLQATGDVGSC